MLKLVSVLSACILVAPALSAADKVAPSPTTAQAAPAQPKMRCKYFTEIGSLAKTTKECHTAAEWDQLAQANRVAATNYVNSSTSTGQGPQ